jgi:hypothetical protein
VFAAVRTADRVQSRRAALARVHVGAIPLLASIVAASFLVRTALAWLRATPTFFSDEYIYSELGRSLAETGRPLIRGTAAHFPALLQPLLTAPAWLFGDVDISFRIVQATGAAAMSLAAVPVFLLARRLELGQGVALGLAALAVAVPDMLYSSWLVAEPFAYPLALGAVAAGTAALGHPRRRTQLFFLLLAGLAAFARVQFAVLPLCYVGALLAVGLRERRLRETLREQALVLGLIALPVVVLVAAGPRRLLGFYGSVLDIDVLDPALAKWLGSDAMLLAYAAGWVLVPAAVLGLVLVLHRPRSRTELGFAALAALVTAALLLEAAVYALQGERIQERYFFYAAPLLGLLFALYARRGWPHRLAHGLLAAGLVALSAQVPLAGFAAAEGKTNSPALFAVAYLERRLDDVGLASLLVALAVAGLTAVTVAASIRRRGATAVALGLALAASLATYAGAVAFGLGSARTVREALLPADPSFVDNADVNDVALLNSRHSNRGFAMELLFWNRSVTRAYLLPDGQPPDAFATTRLQISGDGTLLARGRPVTIPLLAEAYGDTIRFREERELGTSPAYRLLGGGVPQRLALYAPGRYADGWLAQEGSFRLWPETGPAGLEGHLAFRLTGAGDGKAVSIRFDLPDGSARTVGIPAGAARDVTFRVCAAGPWRVDFSGPIVGVVDDRFVSVRASEPVFRPDASACR